MDRSASDTNVVLVITIVRTGGFAGIRRHWQVQLDTAKDVATWRPIIEACPWDEEPSAMPEPDRFVYQISTVLPDEKRSATVPEQHLTGAWRELLDRVRDAEHPGKEHAPA